MRDSFKVLGPVHSAAGKLGRGRERKEGRADSVPRKPIREIHPRPVLGEIKAIVKAETKQLLSPKKGVVLVPWSFFFIKASLHVPTSRCRLCGTTGKPATNCTGLWSTSPTTGSSSPRSTSQAPSPHSEGPGSLLLAGTAGSPKSLLSIQVRSFLTIQVIL